MGIEMRELWRLFYVLNAWSDAARIASALARKKTSEADSASGRAGKGRTFTHVKAAVASSRRTASTLATFAPDVAKNNHSNAADSHDKAAHLHTTRGDKVRFGRSEMHHDAAKAHEVAASAHREAARLL